MEFDIHHAFSSDIEPQEFFDRAIFDKKHCCFYFNPTDNLWFHITRFYNEVALHGKRHIRDLLYILSILKDDSPKIKWRSFIQLCKKFDTVPSAYYILSFINSFNKTFIPETVIQELNLLENDRSRDFGWQIGLLYLIL